MRRLFCALGLAVAAAAALAGSASPHPSAASARAGLPSYTQPNRAGSIAVPYPLSRRPARPAQRSYGQLLALWQRAGAAYGIPWQILAAINKIESNFGRNMGPSSAGAVGWMQFMPSTWERWGMDADGDRVANPWNPEDAVYAAARYLAAAGAQTDLPRAIFAYNHAQWYVDDVLELARAFGAAGVPLDGGFAAPPAPGPAGPGLVFAIDDVDERLARARRGVTRARQALVASERRVENLEWAILAAKRRAGNPNLTDAQFRRTEEKVAHLVRAQERERVAADERRAALADAVARLESVREEASALTFSTEAAADGAAAAGVFGAPAVAGDYVFPVGGGPRIVSVARDHHDYPAADIAAPEGSPVYAHADAVVVAAFPSPSGRCGIGFVLATAVGEKWVYCHLAYLEPGVVSGAALPAGAPVGLVGSTGNSTGPHLHLQLSPPTRYPQQDPWFQGFAGSAFAWRGEAPRGGPGEPVFAVVERERVITFTR